MRLAVVGSRDYPTLGNVRAYVESLPQETVIVSGGARGVDAVAEATARTRKMEVVVLRADWSTYGKAAGPMRNRVIVRDCDAMVAFWDGTSRGTADSIRAARAAGKPVTVIGPTMSDTKERCACEESKRLRGLLEDAAELIDRLRHGLPSQEQRVAAETLYAILIGEIARP